MLENSEKLEREMNPEPIYRSAAGALFLHVGLVALVIGYGLVHGLMPHNTWGGAGGGAMQVRLVSSALPLPSDQPPNDNVLATERPSPAPAKAEPKPVTKAPPEPKAIDIPDKKSKQTPQQQKKPVERSTAKQSKPTPDNRAQYGEQASSSMPRALQQNGSGGPVSVSNGDFGSRFAWYVEVIKRKVDQNWYRQEVDPRTPKGARVYLDFTISRAGAPAEVQIDRSSGSATLDRSCLRGVQRVDSFGPLPAAYNQSTLRVSYYCEY